MPVQASAVSATESAKTASVLTKQAMPPTKKLKAKMPQVMARASPMPKRLRALQRMDLT